MHENKLNDFINKHNILVEKQNKFYNIINNDKADKYLLVDGYNYISKFFNVGEQVNHSKLYDIKKRINKFIDYCKNENYKLIIFIDAYIKTKETYNKWEKRREIEVKNNKKSVPYCVGTILHHYFSQRNIPVYFSYTHDNDDTMASYASELDNCTVLSGDHDFFRYNYKIYPQIYNNFYYNDKKIIFTNHKRKRPNIGVPFRDVIFPLPKVCKSNPVKKNLLKYNISIRGVITSQCKDFGNVHSKIEELRRKSYYKIFKNRLIKIKKINKRIKKENNINILSVLKIQKTWYIYKSLVLEKYPEWDKKNKKVIWINKLVKPLEYKNLENFSDILNKYFPYKYLKMIKKKISEKYNNNKLSSIRYTNYLFSIYASLLELICICENKNLVDELEKHFIKKYKCNNCGKIEFLDIINYNWYKNKFNTIPKKCYCCRKNKKLII